MVAEPDTPVSSYIEAAAAPGTIDYYVVLFSERSKKCPVVGAGLALGKVIMNVSQQDAEPQIRRLKLQWWIEETDRIRNAEPRHPLTKTLLELVPGNEWLAPLERLIDGAIAEAGGEAFTSLTRLLPFCHYAAQRQALLAALLSGSDTQAAATAHAAGVGISLTELLCTADMRLPAHGFTDGSGEGGEQATARQVVPIATDHFESMHHSDEQHRKLHPIFLQAQLHRQTLERYCASGYTADATERHPLMLLWHAWRQARKLYR